MVALARVADTANTRSSIYYDDTAALIQLGGGHPFPRTGVAALATFGASDLAASALYLQHDTGINLSGASYDITAGTIPQTMTLVAGGQDAALVTSSLEKLGWQQDGGQLTLPGSALFGQSPGVNPDVEMYGQAIDHARAAGPDVAGGGQPADLGQIGSPPGPTLATDPGIRALASCLGDVVAAQFASGAPFASKPGEIAVGVQRPASNAATPRVVACVQWPTQAAADQYAAALRTALAHGGGHIVKSWSTSFKNASVTVIGDSQHVVEWQASAPGHASLVFLLVEPGDLPALSAVGQPSA
jgi:hypothetical protein